MKQREKTITIGVRIKESVKEALEVRAIADKRSFSGMVNWILESHVDNDGKGEA